MDTQGIAFSVHFARAACGLPAPGESLMAIDAPPTRVVGDRAEVGFGLSNASRAPLVLQSLELPAGLRLVALRDAEGGAVVLPLRLPPGDYDPPTQPMLGRGPVQRLLAVVEVADCAALPASTQDQLYAPLFQATTTQERGRSQEQPPDDFYGGIGPGGSHWGDATVVDRLRASSCPVRESGLTTTPPARG
jgi:hypothetical protein